MRVSVILALPLPSPDRRLSRPSKSGRAHQKRSGFEPCIRTRIFHLNSCGICVFCRSLISRATSSRQGSAVTRVTHTLGLAGLFHPTFRRRRSHTVLNFDIGTGEWKMQTCSDPPVIVGHHSIRLKVSHQVTVPMKLKCSILDSSRRG